MVKKQRRSMKQKVREDSQRSGSGSNYIKLPQGVGFFTAEGGGRNRHTFLRQGRKESWLLQLLLLGILFK